MSILNKINSKLELVRTKAQEVIDNSIADTELQEHRYKICTSCSNFLQTTNQCRLCGCFMKAKTNLKGAKCPIMKW